MSTLIRNCPNCNIEITYKTNRKFNLANQNNSFCRSCSRIKMLKTKKDMSYTKICSHCNKKVMKFKNQLILDIANEIDMLCKKCETNDDKEKYVRECPVCLSKMKYSNRYNFLCSYENNSKCVSCANKEINSRPENKEKKSKNSLGKNNPMYGKTLYDVWSQKYNEETALEKIKEMKNKQSKSMKGKNNPMYGKPSPQGVGNGWSGHYKNIQFRSLNEFFYLKYLIDNDIKFDNAEKKKYRVEYIFNNENRSYGADFYLLEVDEYIEIKPKKLVNSKLNQAKFKAAKEKYGDKFKILTEDDLNRISIKEMFKLYLNGDLKFDVRYEEKFLKYYENEMRNRK